jgi:hypothetical protein
MNTMTEVLSEQDDMLVKVLVFEEGDLSIWREILQPGGKTTWHRHESVTDSFLVNDGQIIVDIDGGRLENELSVGDHFAVPPGTRRDLSGSQLLQLTSKREFWFQNLVVMAQPVRVHETGLDRCRQRLSATGSFGRTSVGLGPSLVAQIINPEN